MPTWRVVAEPVTYMMVVVFQHSTEGPRIYKVCRLHGASIRLYLLPSALTRGTYVTVTLFSLSVCTYILLCITLKNPDSKNN